MDSRDDTMHRAQRNVLHVGMMLVSAYVLCWTYLTVIHVMIVYGWFSYGDAKWHAAVGVILVNSCINPFIYTMRYQEFQATAKDMICRRDPKRSVERAIKRRTVTRQE